MLTVGLWLWFKRRHEFIHMRNVMFISMAFGLVFYYLLPAAPPRLLEANGYDLGFVDTVFGGNTSVAYAQPAYLLNEYAAIPSFHFGWIALASAVMWNNSANPVVRAAAVLLSLVMSWAIVASANHFFIDMVLGGLVILRFLVHRPPRAQSPPGPLERTRSRGVDPGRATTGTESGSYSLNATEGDSGWLRSRNHRIQPHRRDHEDHDEGDPDPGDGFQRPLKAREALRLQDPRRRARWDVGRRHKHLQDPGAERQEPDGEPEVLGDAVRRRGREEEERRRIEDRQRSVPDVPVADRDNQRRNAVQKERKGKPLPPIAPEPPLRARRRSGCVRR